MSDQQANDQKIITAMGREAKRIEEDSMYSSKSHFNAEGIWEGFHYFFGIPSTVLSAITGAALIKSNPESASICALAASLLTGLMTFLRPNERASMHRSAAGQFLALRNETRSFREIDLLRNDRLDELSGILKTLSTKRNELNQKSPSIPRLAFLAARKGIEEGEATHKVDREN